MAEISSFVASRQSDSYFPNIPPKINRAAVSYSRATLEAPYTALMGVIIDGRTPERHPVTPRCRERSRVGLSNRWRLPESLGSDLLGSSQAIKAISMPYNQSLINIITAENSRLCVNLDVSQPYSFQSRRSLTQPEICLSQSKLQRSLSTRSSTPQKQLTPPLGPLRKFMPKTAKPSTPRDIFLYHSKKSQSFVGPGEQPPDHGVVGPLSKFDVLLKCLGTDWELHRPFLQKSEVLSRLLMGAEDPKPSKYYRSPASETLNNYIKQTNFYSNEYRDITNRLSVVEDPDDEVKKVDHPAHISQVRVSSVSIIKLDIVDTLITKTAMAVALGNLYHDDLDVNVEDVAGVLAAASALGFKTLMDGCGDIMIKNISHQTVCKYYKSASKYQQEHVVLSCERWLELNLISQMSSQIHLREMPMDLFQKVLKSSRLFVFNEYSVYKTLVYWLFLQLNPDIQLMPTHSTVLSFFNSMSKSGAFIEKDGQIYSPLFSALRLHGILDTNHIQDMQIMNIVSQDQLINILSQHYHALQGGGDMSAMKNFNNAAIRQGFVVDDEPHYHSEIMSLHGFHFELKALRSSEGSYSFYMQRLKPGDPMLSFRHCERHTFSMRPDREVQYCVSVQYFGNGDPHYYSTGVLKHGFGLGEKSSRSEVVKLIQVKKPIYVSFAILFPAS